MYCGMWMYFNSGKRKECCALELFAFIWNAWIEVSKYGRICAAFGRRRDIRAYVQDAGTSDTVFSAGCGVPA